MADIEFRRLLRAADAVVAQPPGSPAMRVCSAASEVSAAAGVGLSLGANGALLDRGLQTVCVTDGGRDGLVSRAALNRLTSLQAGRPPGAVFTDRLSNSVEVHQASGVVSVQLGRDPPESRRHRAWKRQGRGSQKRIA